MKPKTIANSKFKNTGVLFELLVRQVTSDTVSGKASSPALDILKKFFNAKTELGKEMQLYRAFSETTRLTEGRALHFIDLIIEQRKKLDEKKLTREKYELVKSIKDNYPLKGFLSSKIPSYTVNASIYKTFLSEVAKDQDYKLVNIGEIATARYALVEHLMGTNTKPALQRESEMLEQFKSQDEDMRMLTYKIVVDKFNDKYSDLNDKQKSLLREYINNISTSNSLVEYVRNEIPSLKNTIQARSKRSSDRVVQIKLNEVASQLDVIQTAPVIRDNEITALMIAYEIVKELES
jgi:hypothetical protein